MPNTIPAAGEAMPIFYPQPDIIIDINRNNLNRLSMHELKVVLDAITAARDAVNGVDCTPYSTPGTTSEISPLLDNLNGAIDLIAYVAKTAAPTDKTEATIRAGILVHYAIDMVDDFSSIASFVQSLAAEISPLKER